MRLDASVRFGSPMPVGIDEEALELTISNILNSKLASPQGKMRIRSLGKEEGVN